MVALFSTAHPAEKFLCPIRASPIHRIGFLVVDALHFVLGVQGVPRIAFVRIDDRSLGDTRAYEGKSLSLGAENGRKGVAIALTDDDNGLALAVLVAGKPTIHAVFFVVRGLHVTAEIAAVDLRDLTFPAESPSLHLLRHGLAQLMQQDESAFVGHREIAREGESRLAFNLVAEDRNGREVAAQGKLVRGEERPAGDREISAASTTAEPRRAIRAAAIIGIQAPTMRADRIAIGLMPADLAEHLLGFLIRHAEDLSEAQGLGRTGKEEMLCHV